MDSVSDRDYIIELLGALSMIMMHLSRFCEEIIMWNSNEYQFIELDDAYSTGSSIMPQKKNPDIAELVPWKVRPGLRRSHFHTHDHERVCLWLTTKICRKIKNLLSMLLIQLKDALNCLKV